MCLLCRVTLCVATCHVVCPFCVRESECAVQVCQRFTRAGFFPAPRAWTAHPSLQFPPLVGLASVGPESLLSPRRTNEKPPLLGVPSPPLSGGRPLLAVSGSSRGWPARVSSSHTWEARKWSAIAGAQGTGVCSRLSPPVPDPYGGRGHTCCTPPWACSVSSQLGATRKRVRTCWTHCVHLGVGSRHPRST